MPQEIDQQILDEFEKEYAKAVAKLQEGVRVESSGKQPQGEWTKKIIEKIKISELAEEFGINACPKCNYDLYFDDSRGFFCCSNKRWNNSCDFAGNLVAFSKFLEDTGKW